jgi:hypothetical protein
MAGRKPAGAAKVIALAPLETKAPAERMPATAVAIKVLRISPLLGSSNPTHFQSSP